jgi:mono/diheme cytochrome c family protein
MSVRFWAAVGKSLTTLLFLVVVVVAVVIAVLLRNGISARSAPTATERFLARNMRHLAVSATDRRERNPLPLTPAALADGRAHFADHCADCHANDGSGQTEMGQNLYPKPPDMRSSATQRLSDGELFAIIKNGVRLTGMPAWTHEDEDSWKLVHFIRHLPKLTPQELEEMKRLNRVSPYDLEEKEFLEGGSQHEAH